VKSLSLKVGDLKQVKERVPLTAAQKEEIGRLVRAGVPKVQLARDYKVDDGTIRRVAKPEAQKKAQLLVSTGRGEALRFRDAAFPTLESRLHAVLSWVRRRGIPISKRAIRTLARIEKEKMMKEGLSESVHFNASDGWAMNFIRRWGLRTKRLHGAAASVPQGYGEALEELQTNLARFELKNIYNMDETGLFYRLFPNRTYVLRSESTDTVRGIKEMSAKNRVTLYVCTNADGTHKLPLGVIGKAAKPACFSLRDIPSDMAYFSQERAWSDTMTMQQWFSYLFIPSIRKRTSQQVALILDNASSHGKELFDPKGQIKVYALPPNTTARLQPMDAGIIAALKCKYKYDLLVEVVSRLDGLASEHFGDCKRGTRGLQEGADPHILDAMELCGRAWSDISERTVARCWAHTGVLPQHFTQILRDKWPRRVRPGPDVDVDDSDNPILLTMDLQKRLQTSAPSLGENVPEPLQVTVDMLRDGTLNLQQWMVVEDSEDVRDYTEQEEVDAIEQMMLTCSIEEEDETSRGGEKPENGETPAKIDFAEVEEIVRRLEIMAHGVPGALAPVRQARAAFFEHCKGKQRQATLMEFFAR